MKCWVLILLLFFSTGCQGGTFLPSNISAAGGQGGQANVFGVVTDAATTDEISQATVTLNGLPATTDQEGQFSFTGLNPGTYSVTTARAGYNGYNGTVTIEAGNNDLDNLPLYPPGWAGTIQGQVISGETGQGLTGVLLSINQATAVTDAAGNYTFINVPPTFNDITATLAGYNDASSTFTVVANASATVNFTMYQSGKTGDLTGTVKNKSTITMLGGVSVSAANQTSLTQDSGLYTMTVPAGTQKATASKNLYDPQKLNAVVKPGTNTTLDFAISLSKETIRKRPYLVFTGQQTSMTVTWQTSQTPGVCKVEWGDTADYKGGSATVTENSSGADEHIFSYTITKLKPASKIYYRVTIDNRAFPSSFMTAPEKTDPVVFYAYGDTRTQPQAHDQVLKAVLNDMAQETTVNRHTFMVHGGDFVSRGLMEKYWDEEFFNPGTVDTQAFLANIPIFGTLGNHECYKDVPNQGNTFDHKDGGALYRKYWPYPFYPNPDSRPRRYNISYDYGMVHVASLDAYMANHLAPGEEQNQWLDNDLTKSDRRWKVVVIHPPIFDASGQNAELDKDLSALLHKHGIKLVLQSHAHYYSRVDNKDQGIQYVTLGGGGATLSTSTPKYPAVFAEQYHFARIEASDASLKLTALNVTGGQIDQFEIR